MSDASATGTGFLVPVSAPISGKSVMGITCHVGLRTTTVTEIHTWTLHVIVRFNANTVVCVTFSCVCECSVFFSMDPCGLN